MSGSTQALTASPLTYTPAISPTLSSYQGLSGDMLIGLAQQQAAFQQTPPQANQQQALQYVQAAAQATDPKLQNTLLQDALNLLTPQSSAPASPAQATGGGASGGPAAGGATASIQQIEQEIQQLQQQLQQLEGGGATTPAPAPAQGVGGTGGVTGSPTLASPGGGTTGSTAPNSGSGDTTGSDPSLSINGNSVNTGVYTISGSTNDDGSLTITNNQTGQTTEVWGDPHIKVNGQDTADFQKDGLNIALQDGTTVHIDPTSLNSNGVAHIGQVSITKGDQAVTMGGTGGPNGFEGGVQTSGVMNNDAATQNAMYNSPTATNITLGADGNLYYDNANGSMGAEITATSGKETDLDGSESGSSATATGGSGGGATDTQQLINQLMSTMATNSNSLYSMMMQQTLQGLENNSGYANA